MPLLTHRGHDIAYEVHGPPPQQAEGTPVLLISGLGYGGWVWRGVAPLLASGRRAVTFDNRGVGGSGKPRGPYSTRLLAEDALGLLDGLGLSRAHVVGHSLGGMVAQELALAAPERVERLVLVGTSHGGPAAASFPPEALRVLTNRWGDPRTLFQQGLEVATAPGFLARHPDAAEDWWQRRSECPVSPAGYQAQLEAAAAHDSAERLAGLRTPTLVVHGAEDRMIPPVNARLLAQRLPEARVRLLSGVGHMVPLEAPGVLADVVGGFLAGA